MGKSVILVSNGALKAALASSMKALGRRRWSRTARILAQAAQDAVWTAVQDLEEDAQGQVLQKRRGDHGKIAKAGLMPSGLHGLWCVNMPPTRVKAFRITIGRCLPGKDAELSLT